MGLGQKQITIIVISKKNERGGGKTWNVSVSECKTVYYKIYLCAIISFSKYILDEA